MVWVLDVCISRLGLEVATELVGQPIQVLVFYVFNHVFLAFEVLVANFAAVLFALFYFLCLVKAVLSLHFNQKFILFWVFQHLWTFLDQVFGNLLIHEDKYTISRVIFGQFKVLTRDSWWLS